MEKRTYKRGVALVSEQEFIRLWEETPSAAQLAKRLGMSVRGVYNRRRKIEDRLKTTLLSDDPRSRRLELTLPQDKVRVVADVADGNVIVFSDAHYLPGEPSLAHSALVALCKQLKPVMVIANGDIFDFGQISRHDPLGFHDETIPVQSEIEVVQTRLSEIEKACKGAGTQFLRTIGNHDLRFERALASNVNAFRGVQGFKLSDHIPLWKESFTVLINESCMVRHRPVSGGIHSAYNSTMKSGLHFVHGHLHRLCVTPWADYTGVRWGVDTGTLARLDSRAFLYLEDGPTPWSSGFAVLTFDKDGRMLPPELCQVMGGDALFRGEIVCSGEDENRGAEARKPRRRR